nr:glutaredoxin 3 [Hymenolepis microstoma]
MPALEPKSLEELRGFIDESEQTTLIYLHAKWADECKQITEVFQTLAKEDANNNIRFAMVDAEDVQQFCNERKVNSVPTVLFLKNGKEMTRVQGANAAELTKTVSSLRSTSVPAYSLNDRLKALINQAPIMLFMKGTPEGAQCKFSRAMLEILSKYNVKFGSFNILDDDTVREGLKAYSNWPTYPQLYVNGELIGGVDIVKEMDEANELASALGL